MKTKDLKKHLNNLVEEVEVSDFDSSLLNDITYQPIKKEYHYKNHKLIWGLLLSFSLILITFIFIIHIDEKITPFNRDEISMSKTKKQFAYQTLGVYSLIEASSLNQSILLSQSSYDDVKKEIDSYLILARNYLDLANIEVKLYKSDKKIYQYMYNFKVDNEEVWFYFSEETQEGNRNIDEVSSDIVGCLYMNNQEYRVVGWKEVDGSEIETTLIIYITDTYYVKVCQEIEHAENEYEFIYYDHNKKQKSLEIEIEQELNMYKVSIEDKDYEGTLNNKMKFKMSDNKILCDIETKSYKGEVLIIINGDYHEYIFKEQEKEKSF